jgi:hypothetical protein
VRTVVNCAAHVAVRGLGSRLCRLADFAAPRVDAAIRDPGRNPDARATAILILMLFAVIHMST